MTGDYNLDFILSLLLCFVIIDTSFNLTKLIFKRLDGESEDFLKLKSDPNFLLNTYSKEKDTLVFNNEPENFKRTLEFENNLKLSLNENDYIKNKERIVCALKFPIKILYKRTERWGTDEKVTFTVEDHKDGKYIKPAFVENNYLKLFSSHKFSTVYNSPCLRVSDLQVSDNEVKIVTERTTYFDSLVTNRAVDYKITPTLSLRSIYDVGNKLQSLKDSVFSNHLGFNAVIITKDDYVIMLKRGNNLSIGKNTYGVGVQASVKIKYCLDKNGDFDLEGFKNTFFGEMRDELSIDYFGNKEMYEDFSLNKYLVCIYREFLEAGKPQFTLVYKIDQTASEVAKNYYGTCVKKIQSKNKNSFNAEKYDEDLFKIYNKEFNKVLRDGKQLYFVKTEALKNSILLPDGLAVQSYSVFNYRGEESIKGEKWFDMLPSTASSIATYLEEVKSEL